jgi:hypothetical protein
MCYAIVYSLLVVNRSQLSHSQSSICPTITSRGLTLTNLRLAGCYRGKIRGDRQYGLPYLEHARDASTKTRRLSHCHSLTHSSPNRPFFIPLYILRSSDRKALRPTKAQSSIASAQLSTTPPPQQSTHYPITTNTMSLCMSRLQEER